MNTETKSEPTFWARIYIAGPIDEIKQRIRFECAKEGLCVTIEPTTFFYTYGEEAGAVIQLINYPRFPSPFASIAERAEMIATNLISHICQATALVMTPEKTIWIHRVIEGERHK